MRIKLGESFIDRPLESFTPTSFDIENGEVTRFWDDRKGTWLSPKQLSDMSAVKHSHNIARDEIAAIIAQHFSCDTAGKFLGVYSVEELYSKLRRLSPIA